MDASNEPLIATEVRVPADYGQIHIYCPGADSSGEEGEIPPLAALDDATSSGRFVGSACGMVVVMTPGQWNFDTPVLFEVWPAEPVADTEQWDHEVDIDLEVPQGELLFDAPPGGSAIAVPLPAGDYRARISGAGFTELGFAGAEGSDHYRLQLWPRTASTEPRLRKSWPGWQNWR